MKRFYFTFNRFHHDDHHASLVDKYVEVEAKDKEEAISIIKGKRGMCWLFCYEHANDISHLNPLRFDHLTSQK